MGHDHALNRQGRDPLERREKRLTVGLIDEYVHHTVPTGQHVAADERRMFGDEEEDLVRLAVELDRLDAGRQLVRRGWLGSSPPLGVRRCPHRRAVPFDEVVGAPVVRRVGEQHAHRLVIRAEAVVRRQKRVDQSHLGICLVPDNRHLPRPVLAGLPGGMRSEPPRERSHSGTIGHSAGPVCSGMTPERR